MPGGVGRGRVKLPLTRLAPVATVRKKIRILHFYLKYTLDKVRIACIMVIKMNNKPRGYTMRTLIIHLRITAKSGKSFLTQTRETGRSVHECLSKAAEGWEAGDEVAITGWWAV